MSPVYEVSLCLIVEASCEDSAVDAVLMERNLRQCFQVEDVTEEYPDAREA